MLGPNPQIEAIIEQRRSLGQDRFDEVWEGEYHMSPGPSGPHAQVDVEVVRLVHPLAKVAGLYVTTGFNLGSGPNDYRVPDGGCHWARPNGIWVPTAAIVWEILSPDDETYAKFDFYAAHGVQEIIVADPATKTVAIFVRHGVHLGFDPEHISPLLGVTQYQLTAEIDWP